MELRGQVAADPHLGGDVADALQSAEAGGEIAPEDSATGGSSEGVMERRFRYDDGLIDYVRHINTGNRSPLNREVIAFESENPDVGLSLEIAMQWNVSFSESVHTFANAINTHEGGTHEEGFRSALTYTVNKFAEDQGLYVATIDDGKGKKPGKAAKRAARAARRCRRAVVRPSRWQSRHAATVTQGASPGPGRCHTACRNEHPAGSMTRVRT